MVHFALFPTSLGKCGIAWRSDVVVATHLPEKTPTETAARLVSRTTASESEPPPCIQRAIDSMVVLLEGKKTDLSHIACDLSSIHPFAAQVYAATRAIPVGETRTYGDIASQLGDKHLAQNVGRALAQNPLPIIVPCHRVVGAKGKLTGFSAHGGVDTKLRMLAIEGARFGQEPDLFDGL